MRDTRNLLLVAVLLLAPAIVADELPAWKTADWPQWRGERQDGVSDETGLASNWPESGPKELWRQPLGEGFSAISVLDGRLITQYADAKGAYLVAIDAASGKTVWKVRTGDRFKDSYGNGPRATPTIDGGVVFALDSNGNLVAVDAASGDVRWKHDLQASYGARAPRWGLSGSPLVEGDLVVVQGGGDEGRSVLAFNKKSGKLAWSSRSDKPGYATPFAIDAPGGRQLLLFSGDLLFALDPKDGSTLWEWAWKTDWGVNASTPIWIGPDKLFVATGYQKGSTLLRLTNNDGQRGVEEVWRNREMRNKFSSSVMVDGKIYGFDEGTLKCVDPEKGETLWRQRGLGHGSLMAADGKLFVLSDRGKLVLVQASPEGYGELGAVQLFERKTWTVPTLAGGRLYVRDEQQIVALDVSQK